MNFPSVTIDNYDTSSNIEQVSFDDEKPIVIENKFKSMTLYDTNNICVLNVPNVIDITINNKMSCDDIIIEGPYKILSPGDVIIGKIDVKKTKNINHSSTSDTEFSDPGNLSSTSDEESTNRNRYMDYEFQKKKYEKYKQLFLNLKQENLSSSMSDVD